MAKKKIRKVKTVKTSTNKEGVQHAAIQDIEVEKGFNVRKNAKPDEELISSVKANGVIHPVHVRWKDRKKTALYLIDGERRINAAMEAGLGAVPIVQHGFIGDKEAMIISLTANDNQKKLTRKEQLEGFRRLKRQGLTANQISEVMAVDKRTVAEALRVQEKGSKGMKKAAQKSVREGGVNPRVAARAANLPKKTQDKLVNKVKGKPLTQGLAEVRKAERKEGVKRPGRKATTATPATKTSPQAKYQIAEDAAARCKEMEDVIRRKLRLVPTHKVLTAQLWIIEVIKGKMNPQDVFSWNHVK